MAVNESRTIANNASANVDDAFSSARVQITNGTGASRTAVVTTGIDDDGVPFIKIALT